MLRIQEKILIHRARRGDQNAFAKLYNEYVEQIQRFVLFKVSDQDRAEELVSTIFTKTLDYLLNGNEIKNFRALLYQIARHAIVDFYRNGKQQIISLDEVLEKDFSEKLDLDEKLDIKLDLEKIKEALKKISDPYREVLILRFVEELSFKEIAKIVEQSEVNVRQIASRGLKLLRKKLQECQF